MAEVTISSTAPIDRTGKLPHKFASAVSIRKETGNPVRPLWGHVAAKHTGGMCCCLEPL